MQTDVKITDEMIEAGVLELREKVFGQSLEAIVSDVFLAMWVSSEHVSPLQQPNPRHTEA